MYLSFAHNIIYDDIIWYDQPTTWQNLKESKRHVSNFKNFVVLPKIKTQNPLLYSDTILEATQFPNQRVKNPKKEPRNLYLLKGPPMNPWLIPYVCGGQCCYLRCGHVHQQLPQKQLLVPLLLPKFSLLCPSLTFYLFSLLLGDTTPFWMLAAVPFAFFQTMWICRADLARIKKKKKKKATSAQLKLIDNF